MITLEIKTSLDKDEEQIFLNHLLKSIDDAEFQTRFKLKEPNQERFIRSVGIGTK